MSVMRRLLRTVTVGILCPASLLGGTEAANPWEDLTVNSENRLPPRTYSMPLPDLKSALSDDLEPETPYRLSLNGTWKISWCGAPSQRPLDF